MRAKRRMLDPRGSFVSTAGRDERQASPAWKTRSGFHVRVHALVMLLKISIIVRHSFYSNPQLPSCPFLLARSASTTLWQIQLFEFELAKKGNGDEIGYVYFECSCNVGRAGVNS